MKINLKLSLIVLLLAGWFGTVAAQNNVAEEIAWVVGDQPIWKSEIEEQYRNMLYERVAIKGDPYCVIPENMAIEKLYLHQADIDTVEVSETLLMNEVEGRINYFIAQLGSKEKMEEYFRKSLPQIRESLLEMIRNNAIIGEVQRQLTKDVKATPSEVRKYFDALPSDSVPYVPLKVEAQIVTLNPTVPRQEIEDVKARLRDYADRVNKGEANFSTLAIMYSEDGSSMQGGELGFHGRGEWVPEFSNVAFNLSDPKKVSRIVETEYGYHIIQLIEKRGDQVNVRHILLTPKVSSKDLEDATTRLDSIRKEIVAGAIPFDEAARYISQDKDTRLNKGIMMNQNQNSINGGSSRFEMQELPPEMARRIEKMKVGDISEAFVMKDPKRNKDIAVIVKLTSRTEGHRANLSDDYHLLKGMYEDHKKQQLLDAWVEKKIKDTHVRIEEGWDNCEFRYSGWLDNSK